MRLHLTRHPKILLHYCVISMCNIIVCLVGWNEVNHTTFTKTLNKVRFYIKKQFLCKFVLKWNLITILCKYRSTSGCPWLKATVKSPVGARRRCEVPCGCPSKATVKSPVGARDLQPLWSFINFIFSYVLLFIFPALPCLSPQTDRTIWLVQKFVWCC